MLNSKLLQMSENILQLGILVATILSAEVIQPRNLVKDEVDDGDDDSDTERVEPDNDNGDNIDPAVAALLEVVVDSISLSNAGHPAEEAKESGQDIDTENGADELP
ncbi:hypothetical protein HG531_005542 [Fusarium graminearum]|nr:hypothetical protein HG531_005542 [Fusarium graminearum]